MKYILNNTKKAAQVLNTPFRGVGGLIIAFCLVVASLSLVSCNDMLTVDPAQLTSDSEYNLGAPGDSVYSMLGVLSKLQKLADSYVLLGELRGDLMNVSDNADTYLKEINDFEISDKNIYVHKKDYYDVINNCNYILQKLDTAAVDRGEQLKLREYAAIKAIRAWTYMQLALNYKTAVYYEKPILNVADAEKDYSASTYNFQELSNKLIADLEPLKKVPTPQLGTLDTYNSSYSYFPIRFLLGDLYLWRGSLTGNSDDYLKAATEYHDLMYENRLIINKAYTSYWVSVNNTISSSGWINWINSLWLNSNVTPTSGVNEVITTITCPTEYGQTFYLDSLNNQSKIIPSAIALKNWDDQTYFLNDASNTQGDMRKYGSVWTKESATNKSSNSFVATTGYTYYIYKYKLYQQNVVVYRSSLLYLRYAEAVNRLEKPKLAFAVIKNGLNSTTMFNEKVVPTKERGASVPAYMAFTDSRFKDNVGIRMRGLGNMDKDTTFYTFPKKNSKKDSILFVEDQIQKELALETAFEGNRFHDLMRITLRRMQTGEGDATYLSKKVAAKHTTNQSAIESKLNTVDNWYIKK